MLPNLFLITASYDNVLMCFTVQAGVSPLYVASQNGHTDVVDLLVRAGADVHLATSEVYHFSVHACR